MKAPISRMGGKSLLSKRIVEEIPEHTIYCEPFVGGGSVFFRKGESAGIREIINDKDPDIAFIFRELKDNNEFIQNNIQRVITKANFHSFKNKPDILSKIQVNKTSFLSHGKSFKGGDNTIVNIKMNFTPYAVRLKNTFITNLDFRQVILDHDSPTTFFYLDPPYEKKTKNGDYPDWVDPNEVFDALQGIQGKFLLSYNDSPNIRQIFQQYTIIELQTTYQNTTALPKRTANELLIKNF
jgi:DNA adenine methylase